MTTNRDMEAPFTLRGPMRTPLSVSNTQQRNNSIQQRNNRDDIRQSAVVSRGHVSPKGVIVFIIIALIIYWAFSGENKPPAKAPSGVYEESLKPSEKPNTVTEGVITPKMDNAPQNWEEATKNARWSEEESTIAKAPESWEEAIRRGRWSDEN